MKKKNLRQILIPAFIITACIPITIFTVISQARLKKSTLDNMNNQAEADLQKSNQCLNMTLDKYETILYDITTAEDFLNLAVTAKESADIMETDAYNMRSEFSHICNRNQGVDGIQLVLADRKRIFYDRLSSSSVNSSWIEKVAVPETEEMLSYTMDQENENPERMFHISRKVVNYWDISEDLGEVILSVDADELSSVLDVGKGSEIYLIDDGRIVGAEDEKLLGRTEDILETKRVSQKSITNTRSGWKIVLCQSLSEYQRAIREQIVFWLLLAVAVLLVFVFLIYKVTEPVMVSVNEIVDAMKIDRQANRHPGNTLVGSHHLLKPDCQFLNRHGADQTVRKLDCIIGHINCLAHIRVPFSRSLNIPIVYHSTVVWLTRMAISPNRFPLNRELIPLSP